MDGLSRIKQAEKRGPVVLLPTHKSYADFVVLSYLFYEHNINIPRIIAGTPSTWPIGPGLAVD